MTKTLNEHQELETIQMNRIAELEPLHVTNTANFNLNKEKLEKMNAHTIEMTNRMQDMTSSIKVMQTQTERFNNDTESLKYFNHN